MVLSLRKVKSTPYFFGAGLERPDVRLRDFNVGQRCAVGFQLFQALLAVVQLWPLGPVLQIFFQRSLQRLGGEFARFHGQGNGFLGDFFLQDESLLVAENSERQLGRNHQPPQVKGAHRVMLLSVRCWAGGPNQAAPYRAPQGTHSSC